MSDSHILLVSIIVRTLVQVIQHLTFMTDLNSEEQYAKFTQVSSDEKSCHFIRDHQVSSSLRSLAQNLSSPSMLILTQLLIKLLAALWTRSLIGVTRLSSIKVVLNSKLFVWRVLLLDTSLLAIMLRIQQFQLGSSWREDSRLLREEEGSSIDDQ